MEGDRDVRSGTDFTPAIIIAKSFCLKSSPSTLSSRATSHSLLKTFSTARAEHLSTRRSLSFWPREQEIEPWSVYHSPITDPRIRPRVRSFSICQTLAITVRSYSTPQTSTSLSLSSSCTVVVPESEHKLTPSITSTSLSPMTSLVGPSCHANVPELETVLSITPSTSFPCSQQRRLRPHVLPATKFSLSPSLHLRPHPRSPRCRGWVG